MALLAEGFQPDNHFPEKPGELDKYVGPDGLFTPEHVSKLFFDSFRFSQGAPALQNQIFLYLTENYGSMLSAERIQDGVNVATPKIEKFASSGIQHSREENIINESISQEETAWLTFFDRNSDTHEFDPFSMLTIILKREAKFLQGGGRPRISSEPTQSSRSDSPHLSQLVFYGLMGRDTGSPEYNAMFSKLVDNLYDIPDSIAKPDHTDPQPFVPVLSIFASHFSAYPRDIAELTPRGLAALQERFEPAELQQLGIPIKASEEWL